MSFSSEYPVARGDFDEILSHAAGDADFSSLNDGYPILRDHRAESHIGTITKAWLDGTKGRATLKLSRSAKGEEALADIKDGILRFASVGYQLLREVSRTKKR